MTTYHGATMGTYGATWEAYGYCGCGQVEELLGSLHGRPAVVAGSGQGVFDELTRALALMAADEPVIFAVNDVGMFLPHVDHWVTLHGDNLAAWKAVRWLKAHEDDTRYHSCMDRPAVQHVWDRLTPMFALSGYFAMQLAYLMGAGQIVLCGCPGDGTQRFFDLERRRDFAYGELEKPTDRSVRDQVVREMARLPGFKAKVRSMSGWTNHFFGGLH